MTERIMDKNILFDLDHTLGFFEQLIHIMHYTHLSCSDLLLLFPDFFRPLFMDFLKSLIPYKLSGKIKSILIYSNNNNDPFVRTIVAYIHQKIEYELFDEIITMEHPLRKKKQKDYHELLEISKGLHQHSLICFVDDKDHPLMHHLNTFYIRCEGYMIRLKHSFVIDKIKKDIPEYQSRKRCLNKNNQHHVSSLLIQRIRMFILH